MRYEVWGLLSRNRLAVFPMVDDAMGWLRSLALDQGADATDDLSLVDRAGKWTLSGHELLAQSLWFDRGEVRTGVIATPRVLDEYLSPVAIAA